MYFQQIYGNINKIHKRNSGVSIVLPFVQGNFKYVLFAKSGAF